MLKNPVYYAQNYAPKMTVLLEYILLMLLLNYYFQNYASMIGTNLQNTPSLLIVIRPKFQANLMHDY